MGTDIHGVFQAFDNGQWRDVESSYGQDRHYQLFAVLAGVRNGYGFAGVPTGEPVTPIAQPRGLPVDFPMHGDSHPIAELAHMDPSRRKWHHDGDALEVWMGDHSHSWLTGEEMLAWRPPTVTKVGILSREEYGAWTKQGAPREYCGGVSGGGVKVINDNAVEMSETPTWTHVRVHWECSLTEELAYFFDEVRRLVAEHGKIRFVFGFDS